MMPWFYKKLPTQLKSLSLNGQLYFEINQYLGQANVRFNKEFELLKT
jgi:hypothetical protein